LDNFLRQFTNEKEKGERLKAKVIKKGRGEREKGRRGEGEKGRGGEGVRGWVLDELI
jgi:hypothetical protein